MAIGPSIPHHPLSSPIFSNIVTLLFRAFCFIYCVENALLIWFVSPVLVFTWRYRLYVFSFLHPLFVLIFDMASFFTLTGLLTFVDCSSFCEGAIGSHLRQIYLPSIFLVL